jgi:hypothetical protein
MSEDAENYTVSNRGFKYWDTVEVDRGAFVRVYESSAAREEPCLWLNIEGEAHLSEAPRPIAGIDGGVANGSMSAHMTLSQAKIVYERLGEAIAAQQEQKS